ncbi:Fic family protein [Hyphococcus luteus]|uniref:Cell filamentation protein Fic n=1 Tax=Hyphococcus luteus TaxID=2058213 RepID=A0A2S7K3V1_9PROT|nr:Fic family protein [Marinicaulis flavus]PQA87161.1 cell filamentation protein Fic [Marinicaulis flavus]
MPKPDLNQRIGRYVTTSAVGERVRAYIPAPLPPSPPIDTSSLSALISEAMFALGRLDGVRAVAPDTSLFLYMYVRKEALLSSQIEGTQSSLSDLLLYETDAAPGAPIDEVAEVSTYVAALNHGLRRMAEGFPLSLRLIREMHGILLATGRGSTKQPGEFRTSQNWIGGTRPGNALFVPPPPGDVLDLMSDLEAFLHEDESGLPVIIKAGLAHVQFETIHPFLDGNGRLGRLLITLYLCERGLLQEPLLYLSLCFKSHRQTYYNLLQEVREHGRWEAWLEFFLTGVHDVARSAHEAARRISELFEADLESVKTLGRGAPTASAVLRALQQRPILAIGAAAELAEASFPATANALSHLEKLGLIEEVSGKQRGRVYAYARYLDILSEGTEPLAP